MVAYGMYGGYKVTQLQWKNNDQVRLIDKGNMSLGDVIVAQDGSVTRVFIYVGDGQLVVLDSATNTCQLSTMGTSYSSPSHILVTLPAYDFYAVLRPSVVA
jgi:cell wall-associated NlpC family hydrolase